VYTFLVPTPVGVLRPGTRLRVGLLAAAQGTRPKAGSSNLNANWYNAYRTEDGKSGAGWANCNKVNEKFIM
jgi:hypothetical protein